MIIVDETNFETEVTQSELPVLVDFSAIWCGPCKKQLEVLKEFAELQKNIVKVVKVDVDDSPNLAIKFGIRSLPTLMVMKPGKPAVMKVGLTSLNGLLDLVK